MNGLSDLADSAASGAGDSLSSFRDGSDLLTDKNRYVAVASDYLDTDKVYVATMSGAEELGRDFCYTVEIVLDEIFTDFSKSVGEPAVVAIKKFDKSTRYYNGIVEEISYLGMFDHRRVQYRLKLASWLTLLKYRKNCRIFQNMTSKTIIEEIFKDYKEALASFSGVAGHLPKREFCVQFNETDFDFVSRLLEQDGIWYYFEHFKTKHIMILRSEGNTNDCSPLEIYTNQNASDIGPLNKDNFSDWQETARLTSTQTRFKDYDHMTPTVTLEGRALVPPVTTGGYPKIDLEQPSAYARTVSSMGAEQMAPCPVEPDVTRPGPHPTERATYGYPGRFTDLVDAEFYAKIAAEREASRAYRVRIDGTARQLRVGDTFKAQNPFSITSFDRQPRISTRWRAVRIEVELRGEEHLTKAGEKSRAFFYKCSVEAVTVDTPFRPQLKTMRPYIRGPQTAKVVGDPSSIHVDATPQTVGGHQANYYFGSPNKTKPCG